MKDETFMGKTYKKFDKFYNKWHNKIKMITYILTVITMILLFVFVIWVFVLNKSISQEMYYQMGFFILFFLPLFWITILFWFIYCRGPPEGFV